MTRRELPLHLAGAGLALGSLAIAGTQRAPWKVLLVVAHPDDEYYFSATVYRLAKELGAIVDHVVISNGEGGYRYSLLAERYYGLALTDERTGRARLPEIRKHETLAAGRVLGVREHYFLDQPDRRFTLDAREALDRIWDVRGVKSRLRQLVLTNGCDFVLTVLPRESTHGHHQAATLLALEAVRGVPAERRPVGPGRRAGPLLRAGHFRRPRTGLDLRSHAKLRIRQRPAIRDRRQLGHLRA